MRAEQVIATHGNTDFDAFGAMLAARLLYPSAVVAVGTLNRNVREFYRLHADELGAVAEVSRLELDAIRRLIVVEVTSASRLGDLEPVALDPAVETILFDHHAEHDLPDWVAEEAAVRSSDGALTTTLVGIVAERELDADTTRVDGVRARHPRGHRLADVRDHHTAGRRRALVVPAARCAPGSRQRVPPRAPRTRGARAAPGPARGARARRGG